MRGKVNLFLTAAVILLFIPSGQALTITSSYMLGNGGYTSWYTNNVNTFDDGTIKNGGKFSSWTITDNFQFVSGNRINEYAAPNYHDPYSGNDVEDRTQYLSVPNKVNESPLSATIYFGGGTYNYLGLWWGSIDKYNSITFINGGLVIDTYDGEDVGNAVDPKINVYGAQSGMDANRYVDFLDVPTFDSIRITSTNYAMELDNLAVANVPEPGTMMLLGLALFGLGAVGVRRRNK